MGYCPNCGRKIENEDEGCPVCNNKQEEHKKVDLSKKRDLPKSETSDIIPEETVENSEQNRVKKEIDGKNPLNMSRSKNVNNISNIEDTRLNRPNADNYEGNLSNGMKVAITAIVSIVPGIGSIIGIIAGLIFMGKLNEDYRSFGKALLIYSIAIISISFICCCLFMFLASMAIGNYGGHYFYY